MVRGGHASDDDVIDRILRERLGERGHRLVISRLRGAMRAIQTVQEIPEVIEAYQQIRRDSGQEADLFAAFGELLRAIGEGADDDPVPQSSPSQPPAGEATLRLVKKRHARQRKTNV